MRQHGKRWRWEVSRIFVIHSGSYSDQSVDLVRVPDEMVHAYRSLFRDAVRRCAKLEGE